MTERLVQVDSFVFLVVLKKLAERSPLAILHLQDAFRSGLLGQLPHRSGSGSSSGRGSGSGRGYPYSHLPPKKNTHTHTP